jgi:Fe-S cluster biogenesis protein NfuA
VDEPEEYATVVTEGPLFERVKAALEECRPMLQKDGGDAELREVEDDCIAIIAFSGACAGCPMSELTVRYGIEAHLRSSVPEILAVEVVADQGLGDRTFAEVLERASFTPLSLD